jgi:hypothetical protein
VTGGGRFGRGVLYAVLAVLGLLTGLAGSLVQAGWQPFGLLLALGGAAGVFWGGGLLTRTRTGAACPAAGWALAVLPLTTTRPQGDYVFAAGLGSYLFLLGGMLLAALAATLGPAARPMFAVPEQTPRAR